jgi:NADH-quinone oxidoreductase subunit J
MIFGVMITRRHEGLVVRADSTKPLRALIPAAALFGVVAAAIRATEGLDADVARAPAIAPAEIGRALVHEHVLAFEAASVLLLGAIIGSIVIARRRDPGVEPARTTPMHADARNARARAADGATPEAHP